MTLSRSRDSRWKVWKKEGYSAKHANMATYFKANLKYSNQYYFRSVAVVGKQKPLHASACRGLIGAKKLSSSTSCQALHSDAFVAPRPNAVWHMTGVLPLPLHQP